MNIAVTLLYLGRLTGKRFLLLIDLCVISPVRAKERERERERQTDYGHQINYEKKKETSKFKR